MQEAFLKVLTYATAIIIPVFIVFLFIKFGTDVLFKSLIDKINYLFEKATESVKDMFHFLLKELIDNIKEIAFLLSITMTNINIYYAIHKVQNAYGVLMMLELIICILYLFKIIYKKGDVEIETLTKSVLEKIKPTEKPEKDLEEKDDKNQSN